MPKVYLAIDIGASSGRHIVGWRESGGLKTEEVYRFPNGVTERNGHLTWDIHALTAHVKAGIGKAVERFGKLESLSVDTWGVDYVLLRGDKEKLPCYAYRDGRTEAIIPEVHEKITFSRLYRRTGSQFQPFNTLYQLYADKIAGRLEDATDFLMIPEYLLWKLCGVKAHEYTNATTTGMVSAETGEYDPAIIEALGLPERLFCNLQRPGTVIGEYEGIRVVLCATHDTGSAVEGIPMEDPGCHPEQSEGSLNAPYISSGTWSLLGVKTPKPLTDQASRAANWSNEGGVGYNRYQKNIMGMWLVNRLRAELCPDKPWGEIVREAEESVFAETVDANAPIFLAPENMAAAFDGALTKKPQTIGDYFRCAYQSLSLSYKTAIEELERNTGRTYDKLYIVGGGAKNGFLNRLTEEATGKQVIALPIEATALGNLKIQMEAEA
jgi:rhamnulokinase